MAIIDIPTGNLPYEVVEKLPSVGEENKIYGVPQDEEQMWCKDYRYHDGTWEEVDLGANIFGFLFADYQESVQETVTEMEQTISAQAQTITALEQQMADVEAGIKKAKIKLTAASCPANLTWCLWDVNAGKEIQHNVFTMSKSSTSKSYEVPLTVKSGAYKFFNDNYILAQDGAEVQMDIADFGDYTVGTVEVQSKGSEVK